MLLTSSGSGTIGSSAALLQSGPVDLGLSDEQRQLVASFTNLLAKASSPERVRGAEPGGVDDGLWRTLLEIGVVTMAVAESRGG